jgi:hypothetical protein
MPAKLYTISGAPVMDMTGHGGAAWMGWPARLDESPLFAVQRSRRYRSAT